MSNRTKMQRDVETAVLTSSCRACCLCFAFEGDMGEKAGQIAHLDHNPNNHALDNLAWLCLPHHDKYDCRTSQSKGFTIAEVKEYRARLIAALPGRGAALPKGGTVFVTGSVEAGDGIGGRGGSVDFAAGHGFGGASGGDVVIGPGQYKAGDGGPGGDGGDIHFRAGDATGPKGDGGNIVLDAKPGKNIVLGPGRQG